MDINNICNIPGAGQQPANIDHILISLSSNEGIEVPPNDFMENHAVPSAGIRNSTLALRESAEVDDGSLPLDLPDDIDRSDMDPPDETLEEEDDVEEVERHPDIEAWIGLADDAGSYFLHALLFALRLLWSGVRGVSSTSMMALKLLLLGLYFAFISLEGPYRYLLIPIILIFIVTQHRSRAGFFLRLIIALMFHIMGRLRAVLTRQLREGLTEYGGRFATLGNLFLSVLGFPDIPLLPVVFAILLPILFASLLLFAIDRLLG